MIKKLFNVEANKLSNPSSFLFLGGTERENCSEMSENMLTITSKEKKAQFLVRLVPSALFRENKNNDPMKRSFF